MGSQNFRRLRRGQKVVFTIGGFFAIHIRSATPSECERADSLTPLTASSHVLDRLGMGYLTDGYLTQRWSSSMFSNPR